MTTGLSSPQQQYLHGYSSGEQQRLLSQGETLEGYIYPFINLTNVSRLLEVGCGVGAQTQILLRRFPHLSITAIDYSPAQIRKAKVQFQGSPAKNRVHWEIADAAALPYSSDLFDGAFLCWVLEHTQNPGNILKEINRTLTPGGVIHVTEVLNAPLFVSPKKEAIERYWKIFNEHQQTLGGDPYVGARLPDLLLDSGFTNIETNTISYKIDKRLNNEERIVAYDYWKALFLSAAPQLLRAAKVSVALVEQMVQAFESLKQDPESILFLVAMQARATKAVL